MSSSSPSHRFALADVASIPLGEKALPQEERLPRWRLGDLYASPDCKALAEDIARARKEAASFADACQGHMNKCDGNGLAEMMRRFEAIQQTLLRIETYASLRFAQNGLAADRAKFLGDMRAIVTDISAPLVFFPLELAALDEKALAESYAQSKTLARYRPWIAQIRARKPHQLSGELERFCHDRESAGVTAWARLFDESIAALRFDIGGEKKPLNAALDLMRHPSPGTRREAAEALEKVLGANLRLFARITNALVREKAIEDRWRRFPTPQAARHLENQIEPEIVDALQEAASGAFGKLSHRYYALKARAFGKDRLDYWDLNAPWPGGEESGGGERKIPWDEAKRIVLDAYDAFSPQMSELARPFFENGWIDAAPAEGKDSGAFSHPATTDMHPYILLNYMGKRRDVMTLAHELGHGVHQRLAATQGELLARTPLTLAETASVFGERLVFESMMRQETSHAARRTLVAGKIEDMLNTFLRQIAFYNFECHLHARGEKSEWTADEIGALWIDVQKQALGESVRLREGYRAFWSFIPHFIHTPFYVYAYAFGDGLVNALYDVFRKGDPSFTGHYFGMLSAGGTRKVNDLLAPFGLDAGKPDFWERGIRQISEMIDTLARMMEEAGSW